MKPTQTLLSPFKLSLAFTLTLGVTLSALNTAGWALTPQSRDAYLQAQQAERKGNLDAAERSLRQAIAMDPQDYLNYVKLASILNQQGKPNEAANYYQQAMNLNPQDRMILYSLGGVYEQMGQYAKAEEAYALSLQNNPRYQFALLNLARAEIQQKKYQPAIVHYQQFLNQYPDHYEARRHLAKLFLVTGQEPESVKQYDILKHRFPGQFGEHLDLARALNGANAPEQALEELKIAYAREGSKSDIDEEMGRAHGHRTARGEGNSCLPGLARMFLQSVTAEGDEAVKMPLADRPLPADATTSNLAGSGCRLQSVQFGQCPAPVVEVG